MHEILCASNIFLMGVIRIRDNYSSLLSLQMSRPNVKVHCAVCSWRRLPMVSLGWSKADDHENHKDKHAQT